MVMRLLVVFCSLAVAAVVGGQGFNDDELAAEGGTIRFVPMGHASLAIQYRSHVILVDPRD